MKSLRKTLAFLILLPFMTGTHTEAQVSGAMVEYFQPAYAHRHQLNPGFVPQTGYISVPGVGNLNLDAGSNLGVSNFMFPLSDGSLGNFMNEEVSADMFLSGMHERNYLNLGLNVDLLSAGWFSDRSFWNVSVRLKTDAEIQFPLSLWELFKKGMYQNPTRYSIDDKMEIAGEVYAEIALGYAREILPELTVGGKLKALVGLAAFDLRVNHVDAYLSDQEWRFTSDADFHVFGSLFNIGFDQNGLPTSFNWGTFGSAGGGGAIDLGAEYRPSFAPGLRFSLGLIDLGFIGYSKPETLYYKSQSDVVYTGVEGISPGQDQQNLFEGVIDNFVHMFDFTEMPLESPQFRRLNTILNIGVEYAVWGNRFSVGLVNTTTFYHSHTESELTLVGSLRPVRWFSMSLGYSFIGGREALGWALNFTPKFGLNLFLASNYTPLNVNPQFLPMNRAHLNLQVGLTVPLGNNRAYREFEDEYDLNAYPYVPKGGFSDYDDTYEDD